jgi:hypothetical protein
MASYLEAYGASEQLRARRIYLIKISAVVLAFALIAGGTLYALVKNRSEEQQAKLFAHLLNDHNYSELLRILAQTTRRASSWRIGGRIARTPTNPTPKSDCPNPAGPA